MHDNVISIAQVNTAPNIVNGKVGPSTRKKKNKDLRPKENLTIIETFNGFIQILRHLDGQET